MRILTHLTLDPSVGRFQFHTQWPSRRPVQLFLMRLLSETKPDYAAALRWNLRDEMMLSSLILAAGASI